MKLFVASNSIKCITSDPAYLPFSEVHISIEILNLIDANQHFLVLVDSLAKVVNQNVELSQAWRLELRQEDFVVNQSLLNVVVFESQEPLMRRLRRIRNC